MSAINRLGAVSTFGPGDTLAAYSASLGNDAGIPLSALVEYLQTALNLGNASYLTQYAAPNTSGFTVQMLSPTDAQPNVQLILMPSATLASGTIALPPSPADGELILISGTNSVTAVTLTSDKTIYGAPSTFAAGGYFSAKYDAITGAWLPTASATPSTSQPATSTDQGVIALSGDLSGTADSPIVPALATKAPVANYLDYATSPRRGLGVGDVYDGTSIETPTKVALVANEGANLVRMGVGAFTTGEGVDYAFDSPTMAALDANIAAYRAVGAEFLVPVTFQRSNGSGGFTNDNVDPATWSGTNAAFRQASMVRWWQAFATRYKGQRGIIATPFNEPHDPSRVNQVGSDAVVAVQAAIVAAIQAIDPARVCTVTGIATGGLYGYQWMKTIAAKNVLYEVHDYTPYEVTHSYEDSSLTHYAGGYPTTAVHSAFALSFATAAVPFDGPRMGVDLSVFTNFLKRNGVVGLVGEFSCGPAPFPVAAQMIRDKLALYEAAGLSYSFHNYLPGSTSPWNPGRLPGSTSGVQTASGTPAYNTITGATNQTGSDTPLAYLRQAFGKNILFANSRPLPNAYFDEDFEVGITGTPWTTGKVADGGGTITWAAAGDGGTGTLPATGTHYALLKHNNTSDAANVRFVIADPGAPGSDVLFDYSWNFRLDTALTGSNHFTMLTADNGGSATLALNSIGTSGWGIYIYRGTGSGDDTNAYYLIERMTLPLGKWTNIRVRHINDVANGEVAVWQDGVLLSIIQVPTIIGTNKPWQASVGYYGTQRNFQCGVDTLRYSRGASLA